MSILRANSRLRESLGRAGVEFLDWGLGSIERILPHVEVTSWCETELGNTKSVWASEKRDEINMSIAIGGVDKEGRSLEATVKRRTIPGAGSRSRPTLDRREHDICRRIAERVSSVLRSNGGTEGAASLRAIRDAFDERVVADHVAAHHGLQLDLPQVLSSMHELAEQTYENKSLTFGALLDPAKSGQSAGEPVFPRELFQSKRYKALSDGYRTSYHISTNGHLIGFVDLQKWKQSKTGRGNYFPEWAENLACASRDGRCGIGLSRQGDILIFDEGTLRFSYRYGNWQYWNHSHLVELLRSRARARHVQPSVLGRIVAAVYRAALDVSFRRSGGLLVLLRNQSNLSEVVPQGDELGALARDGADLEFDKFVGRQTVQSMSRRVLVELASLDGAVIMANSGKILAYGSVLQPNKKGRLRGTEGSRTKAAIGASNYGLAIKISSDGDITVYHSGAEFLRV